MDANTKSLVADAIDELCVSDAMTGDVVSFLYELWAACFLSRRTRSGMGC